MRYELLQIFDMFESTCVEVDGLIRRYYRNIKNADVCLQIKEMMVLFADTMSDETFIGGIPTNKLSETQQYMWTEFSSVLRGQLENYTLIALNVGMYQPYFVSNQTQCDNNIKAFRLDTVNKHLLKGCRLQ